MKYKELNDYELVSRVNESEEITEILFEKYRPLITKIANKMYTQNSKNGLELNDLINEGMVAFSIAINTYNEHKDTLFYTYAKKCIERKIISLIITANRQKHQILNSSLSMEAMDFNNNTNNIDKIIGDENSNPETILLDVENVNSLIREMMHELTAFESQVFDLKKSGFTYKEISEILGVSPKKIDNAIQRIKTKIKKYLKNKDDTNK